MLTASATAAAFAWPTLDNSAIAQNRVLGTRVISHLKHRYHGWPTLTRRANGELLLVCSGGRETHVCPFGRVELMRSHDNGKTWTWPETVLDGPIDDRDAGVVETAKGSILVTTFTSLAYEPILNKAIRTGGWPSARLQAWKAANDRVDGEQRMAALGTWMSRSTDGGVTWSGRYDCLVNSPHGPVQLSDGRLLYAGKELWQENPRIGVAESIDDGKTWKWLAEIPTRVGDDKNNYHELHAVETKDKKLIAHIRNHNTKNARETLQSESTDGGKTWTEPKSIGVWGLPSHLLRLRDNRLLMSYGYRRKPFGNQARLSEDGGATWSAPMSISTDGAAGDLGYPSTVELGEGKMLTVWYEKLTSSPFAQLRQAHWIM
jgi:sialidase-1